MKIGFVNDFYEEERVALASKLGFDTMEIMVDYEHNLDIDKMTLEDIRALKATFDKYGVTIGTVCTSINLLDGDLEKRAKAIDYMTRMINLVHEFGTNIITTNVWGNTEVSPGENIAIFKEVYTPIAALCEEKGVKIAFENCPHFLHYPMVIGNIGFSPEMWELMFEAVPSKALGLEFDPSHLYWLGIDYIEALKKFVDRVYAFHAKDTEILRDKKNKYGILGKQFGKTSIWDYGWWRYRIPGWGEINWQEIYKVLFDAKYDGPIIIEHEDPVFDGELRPQGLKMGIDYLRKLDIPVL